MPLKTIINEKTTMDLTLAKPLKDCSVIQKNKSRFNSGAR
jgi:hypothetical protein